MKSKIPTPFNEKRRIKVLQETGILDSDFEDNYQRLTNLATRIFKTPIALISLVDTDRQWFKAKVGITQKQTPRRSYSFCSHAILEDAPPVFVVQNALKDHRFHDNPLVLDYPYIRFYAGASLEVDGVRLGTLCIVDSKVRGEDNFGEKEIAMLRDLAGIIADMIKQRREHNLTNLHETLHFNGKMLKLLQIPLNHIEKSKSNVAGALVSLKRKLREGAVKPEESILPQISTIYKEAKVLSREVNRFMLISETFTRLLVEIYQLEYSQTIPDLPPLLPFGTQEEVHYQSLSKMNEEDIRKELEEFYHISKDSSFKHHSLKENPQYVSVKWIIPHASTHTPSHKSQRDQKNSSLPADRLIYSYPILMKLLIMLLYDLFDYHHQSVKITIELNTKQVKEGSLVQAGQWVICVEEKNCSFSSARMEELLDFFSVINSVSNCHHGLYPLKSESSLSHYLIGKAYKISIPAYDFTDCQGHAITNSLTKCTRQESSDLEEYEEIIRSKEKRRRSRSSPMSSFLLTPYQMIKNQWKHFRLTKSMTSPHCYHYHQQQQRKNSQVVISPGCTHHLNSILSELE